MESSIEQYEKKTKGIQDFLERKELLESELAQLKEELDTKTKEFEKKIGYSSACLIF